MLLKVRINFVFFVQILKVAEQDRYMKSNVEICHIAWNIVCVEVALLSLTVQSSPSFFVS